MTVPEVPTGGQAGEAPPAGKAAPRRRKRGRTVEHDLQPRLIPQRPPADQQTEAPRRPVAPAADDRFAAGAAVYEALLAACPADERVTEDLEALGVSPDLTRAEGFGAIYPGEHANAVVASLRESLGDEPLLRAPGFAPSPAGSARLDLPTRPLVDPEGDPEGDPDATAPDQAPPTADEESPFALIPYRATPDGGGEARGPILAVEVLDLAPRRPAGSILLGCSSDGRDPRAGGANHLWAPGGDAAGVSALTDGLLEALRATSAGVRCAAIRTPRSFDPGAGNRALPELAGVDFAGRRVLYAPGPKRASTRNPGAAASATLGRAGASVFVLHQAPYARSEHGFGSFLLSLPEAERSGAFARLFLQPVSKQLVSQEEPAPSRATAGSPAPTTTPGPTETPKPEPPSEDDGLRAGDERLAALRARTYAHFRGQLSLSPAMPERGPRPSRRDRSWGNQLAALVGASVFAACMLALAVLSGAFSFLAASQRAMGPLTKEPPADEPLLLVPWFFATVFDGIGASMARFAEIISPGYLASLVALVPALVVAVPLAVTIADTKRRQRIKRIRLHQGRFFE